MEAGWWWFTALWRSGPGTVLLYGAALTHIALAFLALYQRRHLRLPAADAWQLGWGWSCRSCSRRTSWARGSRTRCTATRDSYSIVDARSCGAPPGGRRAPAPRDRAGLDPRLSRPPRLAAAPSLVSARESTRCLPWRCWCRCWRRLGFVSRAAARRRRARRAVGGPAVVQLAARRAAAAGRRRDPRRDPRRPPLGVRRGAGRRHRRPRRAVVARAPGRLGPPPVSRRPRGPRAARLLGPRGEPVRRHSARVRLRRAGALLHLSHPRRARGRGAHAARRSGAASPPAHPRRRRTCGSPVSSARCATWTSCPSCPPTRPCPTRAAARGSASGQEQEVAVLFADIRGFTRFAERRLPYDVVFFLNRYFETVGVAIEQVGGIANQFTGDGVMALFGVDGSPEEGVPAGARAAAVLLHQGMAELGRSLAASSVRPLQIGVGIHVGRPSSGAWDTRRRTT